MTLCDCAFAHFAAQVFESQRETIAHGHYLLTVQETMMNGTVQTHRYHYLRAKYLTLCVIGRKSVTRLTYCGSQQQQNAVSMWREEVREMVDCGMLPNS